MKAVPSCQKHQKAGFQVVQIRTPDCHIGTVEPFNSVASFGHALCYGLLATDYGPWCTDSRPTFGPTYHDRNVKFLCPWRMETFMAHVRPLFLPTPYQDSAEAGRLILRDGTTAHVRIARGEDKEKLFAFFQGLTQEARWRRFFS